jgi:hypothetical protein
MFAANEQFAGSAVVDHPPTVEVVIPGDAQFPKDPKEGNRMNEIADQTDPQTAPLTWSQQGIWLENETIPPSFRKGFNIPAFFDIPDQTSLEDIRQLLKDAVERFESLRTILGHGNDGAPVQLVLTVETPPLVVCEADEIGCTRASEDLMDRLYAVSFDIFEEIPIRIGVVTDGAKPVRMLLVLHHIAVDAWSLGLLKKYIKGRLAGKTTHVNDATIAAQPLDRSTFEMSQQGQATGKAALSYWRNVLETASARVLAGRHTPAETPRFKQAVLRSQAAHDAVKCIAKRHRVSESSIYATLYEILLCALSGTQNAPFMMDVSNRFGRDFSSMIGCMFQPVLANLTAPSDEQFSAVLRENFIRLARACRYGAYPAFDQHALQASIASRRGIHFRFATTFNYMAAPGEPREVQHSRNDTGVDLEWASNIQDVDLDLMLIVDSRTMPHTIRLVADTSIVPQEEMANILRGFVETLRLVDATPEVTVSAIDSLFKIRETSRTPNWFYVDNCWVDAEALQSLLRRCREVSEATVFTEREELQAGRLIAYVSAAHTVPDIANLRDCIAAHLSEIDGIIIPHHFVVFNRAPSNPRSRRSWHDEAKIAREGPGNTRSAALLHGHGHDHDHGHDHREAVIATALTRARSCAELNMGTSYLVAGGRVELIPSVLRNLRSLEYCGLDFNHFLSARSLANLAALLKPTGGVPPERSRPRSGVNDLDADAVS